MTTGIYWGRIDGSVPMDLQIVHNEYTGMGFANQLLGNLVQALGSNAAIDGRMARNVLDLRWPPPVDAKKTWRWLYVARSRSGDCVKVGISTNPMTRVTSLGAAKRGQFVLIAAMPFCSEAHEKALCSLFCTSLVAGNEWFRDTPATRILCWMAKLHTPGFGSELTRFLYPNLMEVA